MGRLSGLRAASRLLVIGLLLGVPGSFAWEWWPRRPPAPARVAAATPKARQMVRTPPRDEDDQAEQDQIAGQAARFPGQVWLEGPTHRRLIALTFDDGPGDDTARLLDVLDRHKAPATFFWQGVRIAARPDLAKRAHGAGHTLGNHTWDHATLAGADERVWWDAQVARTQEAFRDHLSIEPRLVRPPGGSISDDQIVTLQERGLKVIFWSLDLKDFVRNRQLFGAHRIERSLQDHVHEEAIVLLHDAGGPRNKTVDAVDRLIPWLRAGGYELVTVDRLLGIDPYRAGPGAP